MARSRNIKPDQLLDERLGGCSMAARVLYFGLSTVADRAGRLEDRPLRSKAAVLPYDAVDAEPLLAELASAGMLVRYGAEGARYIQIVDWEKYQAPHIKEPLSTIPAPGEHRTSTGTAPEVPVQAPGGPSVSTPPAALIPDSPSLIPDSLIPEGGAVAPIPVGKPRRRNSKQQGGVTWETAPRWFLGMVEAFEEKTGLGPVFTIGADRFKAAHDFYVWATTEKRRDGSSRAENEEEFVEYCKAYFERASHNPWVMGQVRGRDGKPFRASLDYLLSEKGRVQVLEKAEVPG